MNVNHAILIVGLNLGDWRVVTTTAIIATMVVVVEEVEVVLCYVWSAWRLNV